MQFSSVLFNPFLICPIQPPSTPLLLNPLLIHPFQFLSHPSYSSSSTTHFASVLFSLFLSILINPFIVYSIQSSSNPHFLAPSYLILKCSSCATLCSSVLINPLLVRLNQPSSHLFNLTLFSSVLFNSLFIRPMLPLLIFPLQLSFHLTYYTLF